MLLYNLTVGGGGAITALLVVSAIILFLVAWKEGRGVVTNAPVTFYRCDGAGRDCCRNGPHVRPRARSSTARFYTSATRQLECVFHF